LSFSNFLNQKGSRVSKDFLKRKINHFASIPSISTNFSELADCKN